MDKTSLNFEEKIGKTVGRRKPPEVGIVSAGLQRTGVVLFKKWGKGMPKGIYRYQSHEDADRDLMRNIVRET
jgi:hypothetical protein